MVYVATSLWIPGCSPAYTASVSTVSDAISTKGSIRTRQVPMSSVQPKD